MPPPRRARCHSSGLHLPGLAQPHACDLGPLRYRLKGPPAPALWTHCPARARVRLSLRKLVAKGPPVSQAGLHSQQKTNYQRSLSRLSPSVCQGGPLWAQETRWPGSSPAGSHHPRLYKTPRAPRPSRRPSCWLTAALRAQQLFVFDGCLDLSRHVGRNGRHLVGRLRVLGTLLHHLGLILPLDDRVASWH